MKGAPTFFFSLCCNVKVYSYLQLSVNKVFEYERIYKHKSILHLNTKHKKCINNKMHANILFIKNSYNSNKKD